MRNKADRRFKSRMAIKRKENIVKYVYGENPKEIKHYHGNYLNKGKVHCSCPMCSQKTRRNGFKHSDRKKMIDSIEGE